MAKSNKSEEWHKRAIRRALKFRCELRSIIRDIEQQRIPATTEIGAERELTNWIAHLRQRKGPPAPPMPWNDLLRSEGEIAVDFEMAEFKKAQAQ